MFFCFFFFTLLANQRWPWVGGHFQTGRGTRPSLVRPVRGLVLVRAGGGERGAAVSAESGAVFPAVGFRVPERRRLSALGRLQSGWLPAGSALGSVPRVGCGCCPMGWGSGVCAGGGGAGGAAAGSGEARG